MKTSDATKSTAANVDHMTNGISIQDMESFVHHVTGHIFTMTDIGVILAGMCAVFAVVARGLYWIGGKSKTVGHIETVAQNASDALQDIRANLRSDVTRRNSPIRLTGFGQEISETLKVEEWAQEQAPHLVQVVTGKYQFQIFDQCKDHIETQFLNDEGLNIHLSKGAYDNGIEVSDAKLVYAVVLRDTLIELIGPATIDDERDAPDSK